MAEKKKFEKPEIQVVELKHAGVICTSCTVYDCSGDCGEPS